MKYLYLLILIGFAFMIIDIVQGSEDLSWMIGHNVEFAHARNYSYFTKYPGIVIDTENEFVLVEHIDYTILGDDSVVREWIQLGWIYSIDSPE